MIVKRNNFENIKRQNYSIAVGNFDGIHKGHKYLLDALLKYKNTDNSKVAVLSFTPHPIKIMAPNKWKKNAHHWLIFHGRYTCISRKPKCNICIVNDICPFDKKSN